jgi:hypothetical protein
MTCIIRKIREMNEIKENTKVDKTEPPWTRMTIPYHVRLNNENYYFNICINA